MERQPGFFWQNPWCWSSLNKAPLFCRAPPPPIFLCWCRGRDQIPGERGDSSSASPDQDPRPRQTPLGDQPTERLGCSAATGLWLAPPPRKPKCVQDFPPKIDLSSSVFSFFLPLSLLAVTPFPLRRLCPAEGFAGNPRSLPRLPPLKCQILAGLCFPEMKRCRMLPQMAAGDQKLPKKKKKRDPFLFCTKSSRRCPGHGRQGQTLPGAGGCRNLSGKKPS